jgi:hypothetical protein
MSTFWREKNNLKARLKPKNGLHAATSQTRINAGFKDTPKLREYPGKARFFAFLFGCVLTLLDFLGR